MRDSIDATTVIRRNDRVVSRNLAGESGAVLLHLDTAAYHGVNEVGGLVWSLLDNGITFQALISRLGDHLEEAPASLAQDIAGFLQDLSRRNLVIIEAASPASE